MTRLARTIGALAVVLLAVLTVPVTADAATTSRTTFTSAPGLATRLMGEGLLPLPANGAVVSGLTTPEHAEDFSMSVVFPQTSRSAATVRHSAGLTFAHPAVGRSVTLSDFAVTARSGTAWLEASIDDARGGRLRLFDIDASSLRSTARGPVLRDARLTLTDEARARLNAGLVTKAFVPDEVCGSVTVS